MTEPCPMPDELRELIAGESRAPVGADAVRRAIRARLDVSVAQPNASAAEPIASARRRVSIKAAAAAAGLALASAAMVTLLLVDRHQSAEPSVPSAAPNRFVAPETRPARARESTSDAMDTPVVAPLPAPKRRDTPAPHPKSTQTQAPSQASLLAKASGVLTDGDASGALELLEEDARLHRGGGLAEERAALRIEVLVALGRLADARAEARAFSTRYPNSVHRYLIERTLREQEATP